MCGVQKKHAEGALRILAIKGKGQFSESLLSESGGRGCAGADAVQGAGGRRNAQSVERDSIIVIRVAQ
jgi:hypothetical protein